MAEFSRWQVRYGVALLAVAAAIAATMIPSIGRGLVTLLFLAVFVSAGYGGMGPGLFATGLITILAAIGPLTEADFAPWRIVAILTLAAGGVLITWVVEALHVARRRIEASEQQLRQRLDELAEADRRKDEFLAMLAHELRNPLAAISGAVQVATLAAGQNELEWSMDVINRQVKHLSRLIDDLLDVSRITRGKIQLRKERLDVASVLRGAIELSRPLIDARQHKLTVAIAPGTLPAEGDPVRLEQIVTNLLLNAAKYTERGGEIVLAAQREGDAIVVTVKDTGMGIPPGQIGRMFELFAQGDRSLERSEGGLGIGLTLARSLAEMHGGRLTATSAGPGRGSEFVVRLPTAPPLADNATRPNPRGEASVERRLRVLVIDDNIDMARALASLLTLLDHQAWTAHDGPSGLEAARIHRPQVVLLDIGLPGMDGYQVAERLRREEFGKSIRLVAVTGYGQEEDRERALSAGFDQFVTKPVDYATLLTLTAARDAVVR
jgi:signal transduction histidine kinase